MLDLFYKTKHCRENAVKSHLVLLKSLECTNTQKSSVEFLEGNSFDILMILFNIPSMKYNLGWPKGASADVC